MTALPRRGLNKMCKYCSGEKVFQDFLYGFKEITISLKESPSLFVLEHYKDDEDSTEVAIDYCPFCGRKLSKE